MPFNKKVICGILLFLGTLGAREQLVEKGLYDCPKSVYGYALLPAPHGEVEESIVSTGPVPFSKISVEHNISYDIKNHEFVVKHSGLYEIGFFFKAFGICPLEREFSAWVARTLDVSIRVNDTLFGYTKILPFMNGPFAVFTGQGTVALHLKKKDRISLFVDDLPRCSEPFPPFPNGDIILNDFPDRNEDENPNIVYANIERPRSKKDTSAYICIKKA